MISLSSNLIPLYLYRGHPLPRPERLYDYLITAQGIVKRIESPVAAVDLLLAPIDEELIGLRLQPYPLQPLALKVPRIPGRLLQAVLADCRLSQKMVLAGPFGVLFSDIMGLILKYDGTPLSILINNGTAIMLKQLPMPPISRLHIRNR